jgi:hypothetical protein
MAATNIARTKETIVESATQPVLEKIGEAERQIMDSLMDGEIDAATEVVRDLSAWFADKIWTAYLTSLFQCREILSWLRALGARKALRFVSYREISITLPTGTKIRVRSPFFVKAAPKRGRKKRGPQNRGAHLLLSLMGFVHKVEPGLAFRAVQLAVPTPSFETASRILEREGIALSPNKLRKMTAELGPLDPCSRVDRLLESGDASPLENRRVPLAVDGGRIRGRKNKRGPLPAGAKRRGFHTDWVEPKLFGVYAIDEDGEIVKDFDPFVDGTTGRLDAFLELLERYFSRLGVDKASEVVLVGDGAPWIWERVPGLLRKTGGAGLKITEIIDWTHAKQNLKKAFETLSKKKLGMVDFEHFKGLLFSGDIDGIVDEVKSLLKVKSNSKIIKKLKSYFVANRDRMRYAANRAMNRPIGSGVIESAIRRVVNMRVKAPGSFWKLGFAETVIYLRAQLLYGRWENLVDNWTRPLREDFQEIAMAARLPQPKGTI